MFSAGLIYLSQILLARWMGSFEFGIYVYVWTLVAMIGDLSDLGFATSAQRFVPEYTKRGAFDLLRGFLSRSRWLAVGSATVIAATGILTVRLLEPYLTSYLVLPLSIAFATLPFYGLMQMQDGIARSYNWIHVALLPPYVVRHLIMLTIVSAAYLLNFPTNAETAVTAVAVALVLTVIGQTFVLNRKLARRRARPEGLRGQDLVLGLAADPHRRGLLSPAHQRRHRHAAALPLARRRRRLLRRRQDAGADRLRAFRRVRGGGTPLQRVSRHQRPRAAEEHPLRFDPLDVLGVARGERRHPGDGTAAALAVRHAASSTAIT